MSSSDTREILYVNLKNRKNSRLYTRAAAAGEAPADGLMHALRTDIVLWQLQAVGVLQNNEKLTDHNAWMSALQAILKAAAEVLQVHSKDISGMISQDQNGNHLMVIYDSSTSGAGSVLKLVHGNREEGIEIKILERALELCQTGTCCCGQMPPEEGNKKVVRDVVLYNERQDNTNNRLAKACYKCLLSYGNRRHHALLDAYDAAIILNAMLGDALNEGNGGQKHDAPAPEAPPAPEKAPVSEQPPAPQVLAAPEYERVSEEEIMDIRAGKYDDSKSYRVLVNGEYKELMLKRGKTKSARFHLDDAFVEVAYDCVFKM